MRELKKELREAEDKYSDTLEKTDRKDRKGDRRSEKEAKKVNKILWIVITSDDGSTAGDDDWDSDSEDSRSSRRA